MPAGDPERVAVIADYAGTDPRVVQAFADTVSAAAAARPPGINGTPPGAVPAGLRAPAAAQPAGPARPPQPPDPGDQAALVNWLITRVDQLEADLARLRSSAVPGPAEGLDSILPGWQDAARLSGAMGAARRGAIRRVGPLLSSSPGWRAVSSLLIRASRLARAAARGVLRFAGPHRALRAWNRIWAGICQATSAVTSNVMHRVPDRSPAGRAARRLHHHATQGYAHARGYLPRGKRLPLRSYELPPGYKGTAWAKASGAVQLEGTGRQLSSITFPAAAWSTRRAPLSRTGQGSRPPGRQSPPGGGHDRRAQVPAPPPVAPPGRHRRQ